MPENSIQETFDEMLEAEERRAWMRRRACKHCFITVYNGKSNEVQVVCAHHCGTVKDQRVSRDPDGDKRTAARTQEAFRLAHSRGCPRRTSSSSAVRDNRETREGGLTQ